MSLSAERHQIVLWGIIALVCGALALLSTNVSRLIPEGVVSGLHATSHSGMSLSQMRNRLADLQAENARLARDYRALATRFDFMDDGRRDLVRRVSAVERSVPILLEALPPDADIDHGAITASTGETAAPAPAGRTVAVRLRALFDSEDAVPAEDPAIAPQPMPAAVQTAGSAPAPETPAGELEAPAGL
ncbi:hypothetical protein [Pelagibacterium montanilacus]|uniref:hypothetical protein n=1 Tax=Pelagibacterium montanilacus TaxID=2185280 RepID=UPI000F8E1A8F|nr:hypothetical protein [Pelagibacterium montanilacus]